jgi:hypothetical protein
MKPQKILSLLFTALIQCGFATGQGSWSTGDRMATGNIFHQRTMNFGWFDNNTPEVRHTILHEFGHALALFTNTRRHLQIFNGIKQKSMHTYSLQMIQNELL